ncbi:hypothetical protein BLL52_1135 [Rhodoferax antarcticus ANT.BR]|uniref:Uncharacterized protein n=1 Tax=Rhodoferax antarcticus ANT.BR TaxID=1111071 RepID=A0A1Q8YH41_9BURK|nr:hypothetical protein BLL52_1135 [Rhodoferax antarcticus ANT.BR]
MQIKNNSIRRFIYTGWKLISLLKTSLLRPLAHSTDYEAMLPGNISKDCASVSAPPAYDAVT